MISMRRVGLLIILLVLCLPVIPAAGRSEGLEILAVAAKYRFGEQLTITAQLAADQPVTQVVLFLQQDSEQ